MIELKNIHKVYEGAAKVEALKGISVNFRQSEFVAILGPSGGGKTTLLNIIGGLDHCTKGDLLIDGRSTKSYNDRDWDTYRNHTIGFVFQNYNLIPHQTVLANVELALTISGVSKTRRKQKAIAALDSVGLHDQINKKPNTLSGGQMQRVAIARALVNDPSVILADEPTGALDSVTGNSIMKILKQVSRERLVVMVTHNPDLANEYASRIIRLEDGQLIDDSNPYEVKEEKTSTLKNIKHTTMSLLTALNLSLNNLMTKKARTFLTSFAGSIGIIGIALILSLSNGVNGYIKQVQTDTLSSYPLSIRNSSADLSSMVSMMAATREGSGENTDGTVSETKILNDMFAKIGTNDLARFKTYLEENQDVVDKDVSALQYVYNVTPQIYASDTSDGVLQLNPSDMTSSLGSSVYATSVFQEMTDSTDLLESQFTMVAGNWPKAYNEVVLILTRNGNLTDYTEYSLGLRDQEEFKTMLASVLKGEEVSTPSDTKTYSYDDLLNLNYKVVCSSDYYRYNSEYQIYEDMRDDEAYLKNLVDSGIELKVVGIIQPSDDTKMSTLTSGIGYTSALTSKLMEKASESAIVKAQLANTDVDVFTNRTSTEEKNNQSNSSFDMSDLVSIDSTKMASAVGMNIDQTTITNLVSESLQKALANVTTDTTPAQKDLTSLTNTLGTGLLNELIAEKGDPFILQLTDIDPAVTAYFNKAEVQSQIETVATKYSLKKENLSPIVIQLTKGLLSSNIGSIGSADVSTKVTDYLSSAATKGVIGQFAATLTEANSKAQIAGIMTNLSTTLVQDVAGSLNVDGDKMASAITFNITEDDLSRIMKTYETSASKEYTSDSNLSSLDYADADKPYGIDLYFKDFDTKEDFQDFIDDYNTQMTKAGDDKYVITYTDVAATVISSVKTIVDTVSYVLIAFVAVSLVVSSIMIGIITYISVLERIKEIGLLRAMGASKRDVGHVFSAETFLIGLGSGIIGVVATILLNYPINLIIRHLTGIPTLTAELPLGSAGILILISVCLTLIAGIIPSSMAANKDPITALRTE